MTGVSVFKNPHPDHIITIDDRTYRAICSCGFKSAPARMHSASLTAAGQHYAETRRVPAIGEFRASCHGKIWVPVHQLTAEQQAAVDDEIVRQNAYTARFSSGITRWNRKTHLEEAQIDCRFQTTDRAEFVVHMRSLHGAKSIKPTKDTERRALNKLSPWPGKVKQIEDGARWPADDKRTETCACGLVIEVGDGRFLHNLDPGVGHQYATAADRHRTECAATAGAA